MRGGRGGRGSNRDGSYCNYAQDGRPCGTHPIDPRSRRNLRWKDPSRFSPPPPSPLSLTDSLFKEWFDLFRRLNVVNIDTVPVIYSGGGRGSIIFPHQFSNMNFFISKYYIGWNGKFLGELTLILISRFKFWAFYLSSRWLGITNGKSDDTWCRECFIISANFDKKMRGR